VRYWRIRHGLTQKEAAKRMGFDKLYSYQRLEARRCNPSLKIITMVKNVFPEFSLDSAITTRS
jgi:DNA-binding XRE family transcriptional regulator